VGAPNSPSIQWIYTNGNTSGTWAITAPTTGGSYEFRYFLQDGYTLATRSATITVGGSSGGTYTLTPSVTTVAPGGSVQVSWTAPSGRPATDWVGLYTVSAPNSPSIQWTYTNGTSSGTWTISAPTTTGSYEFRYFLQDGYLSAARSATFTVSSASGTYSLTPSPSTVTAGGSLQVSWSAPSGRPTTDWIGFDQVGAASAAWIQRLYTNGTTSGTWPITAPAAAGSYEFRYFRQDGYTEAARSTTVIVNPAYSLAPSPMTVASSGASQVT
jgi:hypothetical protein